MRSVRVVILATSLAAAGCSGDTQPPTENAGGDPDWPDHAEDPASPGGGGGGLVLTSTACASLPLDPYKVTGYSFGTPVGGSLHLGEDVHADAGTPVYAVADGPVTYAHNHPPKSATQGNWGGLVLQDVTLGGKTVTLVYGHLDPGQLPTLGVVKKGAVLGRIATQAQTGYVAHLHMQVSTTQLKAAVVAGYASSTSGWQAFSTWVPTVVGACAPSPPSLLLGTGAGKCLLHRERLGLPGLAQTDGKLFDPTSTAPVVVGATKCTPCVSVAKDQVVAVRLSAGVDKKGVGLTVFRATTCSASDWQDDGHVVAQVDGILAYDEAAPTSAGYRACAVPQGATPVQASLTMDVLVPEAKGKDPAHQWGSCGREACFGAIGPSCAGVVAKWPPVVWIDDPCAPVDGGLVRCSVAVGSEMHDSCCSKNHADNHDSPGFVDCDTTVPAQVDDGTKPCSKEWIHAYNDTYTGYAWHRDFDPTVMSYWPTETAHTIGVAWTDGTTHITAKPLSGALLAPPSVALPAWDADLGPWCAFGSKGALFPDERTCCAQGEGCATGSGGSAGGGGSAGTGGSGGKAGGSGGAGGSTGACPSGDGYYCGSSAVSGQNPAFLYLCAGGSYTLSSDCKGLGCEKKASGTNDACKTTATPSCNDGIQNQGEAGVDCGGPCKACASSCPGGNGDYCGDTAKSQNAASLYSCSNGTYVLKSDCAGAGCQKNAAGTNDTCKPAPSCTDGTQNQGETGIDCGGPCKACTVACTKTCTECQSCDGTTGQCVAVADGLSCSIGACQSGACVPSCTNACTSGAKQCNGNTVETCSLVGSCSAWVTSQTCGGGQSCQGGQCQTSCSCSGGACCSDGCHYDGASTTCGTCKVCNGAGTCGNAPNGTTCSGGTCQSGSCVACTPSCTGKCGGASDGCSGSCNSCPTNTTCINQQCKACGGFNQECCTPPATACTASGQVCHYSASSCCTPNATNSTPGFAKVGAESTFTITTSCPNTEAVAFLAECPITSALAPSGGSSMTFKCKPLTSGIKAGQIKDKPGGTVLYNFSVNVAP